jgi:hypothetical protein
MSEILVGFLQLNENVNYNFIIPALLIYIFFFWIIVSVWVFYDAKKRFQNKRTAMLIAVGNVLFMLPFLLLYLLFRPIEEDYLGEVQQGGLNVPIINFVGEDGVAMTLELKINNHKIMPVNSSEMKVDVSFDSKDDNKKILEGINTIINHEIKIEEGAEDKKERTNVMSNFMNRIKGAFVNEKAVSNDNPLENKVVDGTNENSNANIGVNTFQVKKKKNKKRRH